MKICFLNSIYYDKERGGGLRNYLYLTSQEMARQGNEVTIVTGGKPGVTKDGKVTIVSVAELALLTHPSQMLNPLFLYKKLRYLVAATRYIISHPFDIIEVADTGLEQIFLVFLHTPPIVVRLHGRVSDMKSIWFKKYFIALENAIISKSNWFTIPVKSYLNYVQDKFPIQYKDLRLIPYGIPILPKYKRVDIRSKYRLKDKRIILIVGALLQPVLFERKGTDVLLKVASQFEKRSDITFVVLGKVDKNVNTSDFPKNILFLGPIFGNELHSFYDECTLLFSPARFETFGFTAAEAMTHGKPVVVTRTAGFADYVTKKCGYLFGIGNAKEAQSAIQRILDNPQMAGRMGREGEKCVREFDIKRTTKQTLQYYKHILSF